MPIIIKSDEEIAIMRESGRILAEVLEILAAEVRPGITTNDLDTIVKEEYRRRDVIPTFLGYRGYPAHVCVSMNDEIVHGIPSGRKLRDGDIAGIDLGVTYKGFVADSALTVGVGTIGQETQRLLDTAQRSLWAGIQAARPGARLSDISHAIQTCAEPEGYSLVREYVGHGIGRAMHEDPQIPNFGPPGRGPVLQKGMVLALEPMVNVGDCQTKQHDDNWTVSTLDGSLSAHFEHTIAITEAGSVVLTLRSDEQELAAALAEPANVRS